MKESCERGVPSYFGYFGQKISTMCDCSKRLLTKLCDTIVQYVNAVR